MKTIWKYELLIADHQEIRMPMGAEVLSAQMQGGTLCIWALVDPEASKVMRTFEVFGTGHPVDNSAPTMRQYISTFQLQGGTLVFHLFERTN